MGMPSMGGRMLPEETPEEMEARKRMVMAGGATKNAGYNHGLEGSEIMMNRDGSNGFSMGNDLSDQYKWNEKTGDYRSHGGGIMNIGEMPQQAPVDAAPVGAPPPTNKPKDDWRENIDKTIQPGSVGSSPGMTTEQIVDTSGMDNFMDMGGSQGGHINPLVDPSNWMHQVNPDHLQARNVGIYKNPAIDDWLAKSQKGLLSKSGGLV